MHLLDTVACSLKCWYCATLHLRDAHVCLWFLSDQGEADIKYIDPTYMIRAIPTTTNDRVYCKVLGQGAVHAAFAGELKLPSAALPTELKCGAIGWS